MASLSSGIKIGTGSVSSLIKSAASLTKQLQAYQDSVMADNYAASAKTDGDFQTYANYLQSRINSLSSTGTLTDAQKALTLSNSLRTATNSNISASILRENIQVMAGNASPQDKLNLIQSQFMRAVGIGDMSTAQSLESQAYSLSQTIQLDAQNAAASAASLAKSGAGTTASGQNSVATQIEEKFRQLNQDTSAGGMAALNKNLKSWVKDNKASLLALADGPGIDPSSKAAIEKAVKTSQPNYQDVAMGVGQAMIAAHYLAYQSELPFDPATAQHYLDSATNLANGSTKIETLAGSMTLNDVQTWQQNPAMFVPHENADKGTLAFSYNNGSLAPGESAIAGYKYDSKGNVIANFTGNAVGTQLTPQQISQTNASLKKLGFSFKQLTASDSNTNGISVQATDQLPKWLKPLLAGQQNAELQAYITPQGIQLATLDQNGKGHVYLVAQDKNGNHAVYTGVPDKNGNVIYNKQTAAGNYGFNQKQNSLISGKSTGPNLSIAQKQVSGPSFGISNLKDNIESWLGLKQTNAAAIVSQAQLRMNAITQARIQAQSQLQLSKPMSLPKLPSVQMPNAKVQPQPNTVPVAQPTVNPQQTGNPQPQTGNPQPGAVNPQGGNFNPQQGGTHVANLTPSSGAGIKL